MLTINDIELDSVDAVIFDLDGTLYNKRFLPVHLIFGEIGRLTLFLSERIARKSLKGQYFGSEEAFWDAFFGTMASHSLFSAKWAKRWYVRDYMPLMIKALRVRYHAEQWALELLPALHSAGKKIAVFSDYDRPVDKLEVLGYDLSMFDLITCGPEQGGLKPSKEVMENVVRRLGVSPERCLVVGDREDTDGASAKAVGAKYFKIDYKKHK